MNFLKVLRSAVVRGVELQWVTPVTVARCRSFCTLGESEHSERKFKRQRGTGDKGKSGLFSNDRLWKDDSVFEAIGTVDELNSAVGFAREAVFQLGFFDISTKLEAVQCRLQDIGANLATPRTKAQESHLKLTGFSTEFPDELDVWIDSHANQLPALTKFILPGGSEASGRLHLARSICRRAERRCVPILRVGDVEESCVRYLNRLSDFLFILARFTCLKTGRPELIYKKATSRNPPAISTQPLDSGDAISINASMAQHMESVGSGSLTVTLTPPAQVPVSPHLRLELERPGPSQGVSWAADVVDNEFMGKKTSKCCCQYVKPKKFDESSSESDTDKECDHCQGHVEKKKKMKKPAGDNSDKSHHNHNCAAGSG